MLAAMPAGSQGARRMRHYCRSTSDLLAGAAISTANQASTGCGSDQKMRRNGGRDRAVMLLVHLFGSFER